MPGMTCTVCPTNIPLHHLKRNRWAPVMVIQNVLHPNTMSGKMIVVTLHTRTVVLIVLVGSSGQECQRVSLHRIRFQFSHHCVRGKTKKFPSQLDFAGRVRKEQGLTAKTVIVHFRSVLFPPAQIYVTLFGVKISTDALIIHREEHTTASVTPIHDRPITFSDPVLRGAVTFPEGC